MKQIIAIAVLAIASMAASGAAGANSSRVNPPPLVLSPNLAAPWVNQLRPGYTARKKRASRRSIFSRDRPAGAAERPARKTRKRRERNSSAAATHLQANVNPAPRQQGQTDAKFLPTVVDYQTSHEPGTVIIDTASRHLYLVEPNGRARRYGVGVGKQGFEWSGTERISRKSEWPDWRPPVQMIAREKSKGRHLPSYMPGGPNNPLGARALYLGSTLYRIHGSNRPSSIGRAVSSGCIRMRNEDVSDLYDRVGIGTKVVVL